MIANEIDREMEEWFLVNSSSESESSDSDAEPPVRRRRTSIRNYLEETVWLYTNLEFKSHFRLTRVTTYGLIDRFQRSDFLNNSEPRPDAITHERAFLLTLWYLANTESFRHISDRFNVTCSSAHRVLINTIDFLNSLQEEIIRWPTERNEINLIRNEFSRIRNIHGVIGAIDGCHIRIRRPCEHQEDYYNRKKFHSIVLQAIVTSKKKFLDIYIGEPGSMHDARVLRRSPIYEKVTENPGFFQNHFLVGDSAYPNLPWLVPPFRDNNNLTVEKRRFNARHASTRVPVEQTFGALQCKFRRLQKLQNLRLDIIVKCVMCSCILHNICLSENHDSDEDNDDDNDSDYENNAHPNVGDRRQMIFNRMFPGNDNV